MKKYFIYIITIILYYCFPALFIKDTGSAMFIILLINPLILLISSIFFTKLNGFKWYYSIIIGLLWLPNIFVHNSSILIYAFIYGVIFLIGQGIGILFLKAIKNKEEKKGSK